MADVVLVVAADGEPDGVFTAASGWEEVSSKDLPPNYSLKAWKRDFTTIEGRPFRVLLSQAPSQRAESTTTIATQLVTHFLPTCLAMCGVCAGKPGRARLGDVIVGSHLYKFNAGANKSTTKRGKTKQTHTPAIVTYNLPAAWKQAAERLQVQGDWARQRPIERGLQEDWLITELHHGRMPSESPERGARCADWKAVVVELRRKKLLRADTLALTAEGKKRGQQLVDEHPDGLPDPRKQPVDVIAAPFGTSDNIEARRGIWDDLELHQYGVAALDMEASAIGLVAQEHRVPVAIVAKGVMDYADEAREYGFRKFAALASAEVLLQLLQQQLDREPTFRHKAEMRKGGAALSPAALTLVRSIFELEQRGQRYEVPATFVRESKARTASEAELHRALREARGAKLIEGDGKWMTGKVAALTDAGREVLRFVSPTDESRRSNDAQQLARDQATLAEIAQVLDRPAFTTPFQSERELDHFMDALEDTIRALNTGGHRTRDGKKIAKRPTRHHVHDPAIKSALDGIVDRVEKLRALTTRLLRSHKLQSMGTRWVYATPEAQEQLNRARAEILDSFAQLYPAFTSRRPTDRDGWS